MKHYAGIDLPMETAHVCVVNADARKIGAFRVDSTPAAIAAALERYGSDDAVSCARSSRGWETRYPFQGSAQGSAKP